MCYVIMCDHGLCDHVIMGYVIMCDHGLCDHVIMGYVIMCDHVIMGYVLVRLQSSLQLVYEVVECLSSCCTL